MTQLQLDLKNFRTHFADLCWAIREVVGAEVPDDVTAISAWPEFKRFFLAEENAELLGSLTRGCWMLRDELAALPAEMRPAKELTDSELQTISNALKPIAEIFYRMKESGKQS